MTVLYEQVLLLAVYYYYYLDNASGTDNDNTVWLVAVKQYDIVLLKSNVCIVCVVKMTIGIIIIKPVCYYANHIIIINGMTIVMKCKQPWPMAGSLPSWQWKLAWQLLWPTALA